MPAPFLNRDRLRLLHARGLSDAEIAAKLGVTGQTVQRHRRVLGLPSTSIAKLWTPEMLDELRRRAAAEETAAQIAAAMGLREAQVRGASKNHRIPLGAARSAAQRALRARIAGMVREGCTPTGIARELGMTPRSVRSQIDRMRARGDLPPAVRSKPKPEPAPVATSGPLGAPVARPTPRPVMRLPAEARSAVSDLRQGRLARLAERHGADLVQALAALGRQRVYARLREVAQVHRVPVRTAEVIWHQVRP